MEKITKSKTDYLIIGNSAAGVSAAENIRKIDKTGGIEIFSSENFVNYSRPLITYYLSGKIGPDRICFKSEEFYSRNNIILNLSTAVTEIDTSRQEVITDRGRKIGYGKLLIASGGKPVIPFTSVTGRNNKAAGPGSEISRLGGLEGIFTLTNLADAVALRRYIEENSISSASILGGGLIGLKTAEAFLEMGLNINIIELSGKILSASFDEEASEIISERVREAGSSIFTGSTIESIRTDGGKIKQLTLTGGKVISCELLVVAVGVKPDTGLVRNWGIKDGQGIIVDEEMRTDVQNVYAAGDVTRSHDRLSGQEKNIAIWPLAVRQGAVAGKNMAGQNASYRGGFFMNSVEILGVPVISLGLSSLEESSSRDIRVYRTRHPEKQVYRKIITRNSRVIGAIFIGAVERAGIYAGLISNEIDISEVLGNISGEDFGILQLPADYKKHLVVGEGVEV